MASYPLPPISWDDPAVLAFVLLPAAVLGLLVWGSVVALRRAGRSQRSRRRSGVVVAVLGVGWMALTWGLADRGMLLQFESVPPPFALLVLGIVLVALVIAYGPLGAPLAALPLWVLVGVQAFRLPLEIAMHEMAERGVMPEQMSYTGYNFDIVTGLTAIVVAALARSGNASRALVLGWNVLGSLLLVNIMTIAILSTPAFRAFGDDRLNTWVMHPPFVWLPTVLVLAALAGHLLIFRALRRA
jgi:hypothetical protein